MYLFRCLEHRLIYGTFDSEKLPEKLPQKISDPFPSCYTTEGNVSFPAPRSHTQVSAGIPS